MKTDLDAIKKTSKLLFDTVPIKEEEFGIVVHPFVSSAYSLNPDTGKMIDLQKPEELKSYKEKLFEFLDNGDIYRVLGMINSGWKMTWFKCCSRFMSDKDYGELLAYCWVRQENPNQDVNVSREEAVQYFRKAEKQYLMEPEDLEVYNSLPDVITVYRGVAKGREKHGLSWTNDREKAEWFQTRFGEGNCLLKATVPKKSILAYFNSRNERELVVDVFSIVNEIEVL